MGVSPCWAGLCLVSRTGVRNDYVMASVNTRIYNYGTYGEYRDTFNVYAAHSVYQKTAWPCWLCSSKLALWEDKDSVWIGAGVVEKQARKRGLLAQKMTTCTKCSCATLLVLLLLLAVPFTIADHVFSNTEYKTEWSSHDTPT